MDGTPETANNTENAWDRAYGAFLGLLCGDAAGATLEFSPGKITAADVERALQMPGGGVLRVGRGQITDDSELALSLAQGLVEHDPALGFPTDAVAKKYAEWHDSRPFDIGNTCGLAFGIAPDENGAYGERMTLAAVGGSMASEANGALMRVLPIALWSSRLPQESIATLARQDATLSHPNPVCQDCNAIYCQLIAHLIHHPGDYKGAIQHVEAFVKEQANPKVQTWFSQESLDISNLTNCKQMKGHVRWGFVLAIHFLRQNTSYEDAIRQTLLKGGDTDTNAAIVGGLIGALHGERSIPERMKAPVLGFDCTQPISRRKRPATYKSDQILALTQTLTGIVKP
uniref:ADP-ribosylglycohydrolase n=1 Tax=Globisporangium ultimum (strain ATCC 200006 / CBS 805.95 / DAOM BR144) TaxID=431595 RepID=K3WZ12_GLOUD